MLTKMQPLKQTSRIHETISSNDDDTIIVIGVLIIRQLIVIGYHMTEKERPLDNAEKFIARQLIKNPRATDKSISESSNTPLRTVGRRRRRLEEEGILRYYAEVDLGSTGTRQNASRHMYTIRFRSGVRLEDLRTRVGQEEAMMSYSEIVCESYIAESDGHLSIVLIIEGVNEETIVRQVHDNLIPSMIHNHGEGAIVEVSAMRLVECSRKLRNYLPAVNIENGCVRGNWSPEKIYVGE